MVLVKIVFFWASASWFGRVPTFIPEREGFGLHNMTVLVDNFVRDILSLIMINGTRKIGTILGTCMVEWAV